MSNSKNQTPSQRTRNNKVGGLTLIVLGSLLLLQHYFDYKLFAHLWPLLLIGFGIVLVTKNR